MEIHRDLVKDVCATHMFSGQIAPTLKMIKESSIEKVSILVVFIIIRKIIFHYIQILHN